MRVRLDILTELAFEARLEMHPSGSPMLSWDDNRKALYNRWVCEKRKSRIERAEQIKEAARKNFRKFRGGK